MDKQHLQLIATASGGRPSAMEEHVLRMAEQQMDPFSRWAIREDERRRRDLLQALPVLRELDRFPPSSSIPKLF